MRSPIAWCLSTHSSVTQALDEWRRGHDCTGAEAMVALTQSACNRWVPERTSSTTGEAVESVHVLPICGAALPAGSAAQRMRSRPASCRPPRGTWRYLRNRDIKNLPFCHMHIIYAWCDAGTAARKSGINQYWNSTAHSHHPWPVHVLLLLIVHWNSAAHALAAAWRVPGTRWTGSSTLRRVCPLQCLRVVYLAKLLRLCSKEQRMGACRYINHAGNLNP